MATVGSSLSSALSVMKGVGSGSLYELRRNGSYVLNINHYSNISTTTPALSQLVGKIKPVIALDWTSAQIAAGTGVTATIEYQGSGSASATNQSSGTWLLGGSAGNYEILINPTLGAAFSGGSSVNTWLSLASSRSWYNSAAYLGYRETTGNIAIRDTFANIELANTSFIIVADGTA